MEPPVDPPSPMVRILLGKGGVGKTSVAGALALALARRGRRVALLELEGRPELARMFGLAEPHGYQPARVHEDPSGGWVELRRLTPDDALVEYLADHGLGRLSKRLARTGLLDVVASAIPGIKDVLVLGKVKQLANEGAADELLLDAPATGHAMTLLSSAAGLAEVARSGPVRRQADEVLELLRDPGRCEVSLVTLPEELPVSEAVEAAFSVEDAPGVALGPIVVNRMDRADPALATTARTAAGDVGIVLDPSVERALDRAAAFQRARAAEAVRCVDRLAAELPLPRYELPRLAAARIGPAELAALADALGSQLDEGAVR
jgi:Anion-transporting ATPase